MTTATTITITGSGTALPGTPVPSETIAGAFGLSPVWAEQFIGTRARHLALDIDTGKQFETLESLGAAAAEGAMAAADVDSHEIDFIVLATATPDELMPSTANRIAVRLGMSHLSVYQVQSGCAGAVQAFDIGRLLLESGRFRAGLVIGGDVCVRHFETRPDLSEAAPTELVNYLLFGDGVGAAVLTSEEDADGLRLLDVVHETTAAGGSAGQVIRWFGAADLHCPENAPALMEDYKAIERLVPELAGQMLDTLLAGRGWRREELAYLLPPQLAGHITDRIAARLEVPDAQVVSCVAETGNCGNALPFLQLHEVTRRATPGDRIVCVCIESSMWIKAGLALEVVGP